MGSSLTIIPFNFMRLRCAGILREKYYLVSAATNSMRLPSVRASAIFARALF